MSLPAYVCFLPEYLRRITNRVDTLAGISIGIILYISSILWGFLSAYVVQIEAIVLVLVFLEAGYGVFRQERMTRSEHESQIRLVARPSSYSVNLRSPGPDEIDIHAIIKFEIWSDVDVDTSGLVLNLVGVKPRLNLLGKWQIGKITSRIIGLWLKGQDTAIYRKNIRAIEAQPFEDFAEFDWKGKFDWQWSFFMELALITGRPHGNWRTIVDSQLHERGSREPV